MTELDFSRWEESLRTSRQSDYMPILEDVVPENEFDSTKYHKKLRRYFLHGNKETLDNQMNLFPVLLAPFLRGESSGLRYPLLYDYDSQEVTSLAQVLYETFFDIFESGEAEMLAHNLPGITSLIEQKLHGQDPILKYDLQIGEIIKSLQQLGSEFKDPEVFDSQCEQISNRLLNRKATLIGLSGITPFQLLSLQLNICRDSNRGFLSRLKKCISGLNEILLLHGEVKDNSPNHFDFAGELISFEKVEDMATPGISSSLPEERLSQLRECLQILSAAQKAYSERYATIFVTQNLAEEFGLKKTMNAAHLEITAERSCAQARNAFKKEFSGFVKIIAAMRLAELEINQQYDEELHAPYFESFESSYLKDEDIRYFRPLIVVEESRKLMNQPKDFLGFLSEGALVKVLAINRLDELMTLAHYEDDEAYLELAALAIFRRNAYVFQGGSDSPGCLNEAFRKGLDAQCPSLWNILFTNSRSKLENVALRTAVESRYFPRLIYDVQSGADFGSHFNISRNPQPELPFPVFDRKIRSSSGPQTSQFSLTMADFLALSPDNLKALEILPTGYRNEDLVPLTEYLTLTPEEMAHKIPFIRMVDEANKIKRAVIPLSWIRQCKARLDYWYFFQELGGTKSVRLQNAVMAAQSVWEENKRAEIEDLKTRLQAEYDRARTDDLEKSISRMLNSFLDQDNDITDLLTQSAPHSATLQEEGESSPAPKMKHKGEEVKTMLRSEVWVESDECTSCNDCIEALPSVFKYNEDKQAIVHNPKGGTYAKIVATAEKCPARCIHPGLPHNPNEPGLEKLIKRGEKYN